MFFLAMASRAVLKHKQMIIFNRCVFQFVKVQSVRLLITFNKLLHSFECLLENIEIESKICVNTSTTWSLQ